MIERLQPLDRHVLDVREGADHRAAVVVPQVGRAVHPVAQQAERAVLARLELVAHHRHLALEVGLRDARVHHPVGLEVEHELEQLGPRREGAEVVGAVEGRGAVVAHAVLHELALRVGVLRCPFEDEVLEQVRHAALAVAFVAGADQVGDVDGDRLLRPVGKLNSLMPPSAGPRVTPAGSDTAVAWAATAMRSRATAVA
jgi:hypothetical protein